MGTWRWILIALAIAAIKNWISFGVNGAVIPELSSIFPSAGPNDGGFAVTANGLFVDAQGQVLTNGITCQFGASLVNAVIVNARTITCTAPSFSIGKTSFKVLANNEQWSNTTLTFTFYSCSALSSAAPCTDCLSLPLCGICIPTMQCASLTSCSSGFVSKCPTITSISPNTASINGGMNLTVTFDTSIPQTMSYECSYGTSITNSATLATVISSHSLTCAPPMVTNNDWTSTRGTNREVVADLVITVDSSVQFASKSSSISLFDCDTYGQDCESCNSARTNGACAFCFDSQSCRYSNVSCATTGTCTSITSVSPATVFISTVQSGQTMTVSGVSFAQFNGQSFVCAFDSVGDSMSTSSEGIYQNASSLTCDIPKSLSVGAHSISLWLYNSVAGSFARVVPNFDFNIYDCETKSCTTCLDGTRPECVYCTSTASCDHSSSSCSSTKLTSLSSCPTINSAMPNSSPLTGGITIALNGSLNASVLDDPSNVSCVWTHDGTSSDVILASLVTTNSVQCLSPTVSRPVIGSVHLTALGNTEPWTNSLPFSWFDCANITSSCGECLSASQSCRWCITHCATSCDGASHELNVCPTITSITPSFIRANSDAQQVIRVTGGPFYDDVEHACLFDDLTGTALFINSSTIDCTAPLYLSDDTTLSITAYGQSYTNAIDIDVSGCQNTNGSSSCSSQCTEQEHCGWCVASSTCSTQAFCAPSQVLLEECLEISVSPSTFDSKFDTTATITVSPRVPQVWYSAKRTAVTIDGLNCYLSTGDSIPAIITNETTLTCDLPKLITADPVIMTIKFQNQTLVDPIELQSFDCSPFTSCETCLSASACNWCPAGYVIAYNCSFVRDCSFPEGAAPWDPSVVLPAFIVPTVVAAVGIAVLVVLLKRRKRRRKAMKNQELTNYTSIDSMQGKHKKKTKVLNTINQKMEIPFASLEMKKEIGSGSYGKVYLGQWQGAKVAIKVCASIANIDGFFDEATLTIALPPHPNVVQTFGISVDGALPCIVLEYCGGGSLDKKIFNRDASYSSEDQVRLIKGIARGLLHLHTNNIIHRDLAARNILLTRGGKPKISDFGMSRLLKEESQKGQTKSTVGPLKWMAPESIRDTSYSTKSDVWTFGILIYEILSGHEPHAGMDNIDVGVKIKNDNYHPEIFDDWHFCLKNIMLSCWHPDPEQRPTMKEINKQLQDHFVSDEDSDS